MSLLLSPSCIKKYVKTINLCPWLPTHRTTNLHHDSCILVSGYCHHLILLSYEFIRKDESRFIHSIHFAEATTRYNITFRSTISASCRLHLKHPTGTSKVHLLSKQFSSDSAKTNFWHWCKSRCEKSIKLVNTQNE